MWEVGSAPLVGLSLALTPNDSELHVFRGHQPSPTGFIMGHEFTGTIEEVGEGVKSLKKGDQIVAPFTVSWSARAIPTWRFD